MANSMFITSRRNFRMNFLGGNYIHFVAILSQLTAQELAGIGVIV